MSNFEIVDDRDKAKELARRRESERDSLGKAFIRFTFAVFFYHTVSGLLSREIINTFYWISSSWLFVFGFSPRSFRRFQSHRRVVMLLIMSILYALLCSWLIMMTPQEADLARIARRAIKSVALIIVN